MSLARVSIHASQFPDAVRRDLLASLRERAVNHKFHYDSFKQTQKWLALHQAWAPSRNDPDCAAIYDLSFAAAATFLPDGTVHLVGLGCGGGLKDARLLRQLFAAGHQPTYTPSDVSVAMVLVARREAQAAIGEDAVHPLVCDLASATDLRAVFAAHCPPSECRLFTFFGMIPNFEPATILPKLASLLRPSDHLLFSANLAPGNDYSAGVQKILPGYDNPLTRDWLLTFLFDLGVEPADGELKFVVEEDPSGSGLLRVAAYFQFSRYRMLRVDEESFAFAPTDRIRLFFSYRHTPRRINDLLGGHGIQVVHQWITKSDEEGVFLCRQAN